MVKQDTRGWIIRTEGLGMRYAGSGVDAVDSLSITIEAGTIHGILGPNGAGKTTTLSMLCGLIEPTRGRIQFAGHLGSGNIRRFIGYVPQDLALYPNLTGRENLTFFGRLYGVTGRRLEKRIAGLLEMVGLEDRADELLGRYSTGMKRRLNLAAGLLHEPRILLLDEPTVGVDPQSRNRIFEFVEELEREGATILYTTHYMEEASRLCDEVAIMDRGKVLLEGNPRALADNHGRARLEFDADPAREDLPVRMRAIEHVTDASLTGGILSVQLESRSDNLQAIEDINAAAARQQLKLKLLSIVEPSLETIFLDITGRDLKDEVEPG